MELLRSQRPTLRLRQSHPSCVQKNLYAKALKDRDDHLAIIDGWKDFSPNLNSKKLLLVPFCGDKECEESIKEKSKEEA